MSSNKIYLIFLFIFIVFFPYILIPYKVKIFLFEFLFLIFIMIFIIGKINIFLTLRKFEMFYLIYLLYQIILLEHSEFLLRELFGLHIIIYSYLLMILFSNINFPKQILVKYLTISYFLFAFVILFLIIFDPGTTHKIHTFLGKSNYLASILLIPIGYIGIFMIAGIKNYIYFFTFIVSAIDVVMLKSRTATVILLVYLLYILFSKASKILKIFYIILILIVVFFAKNEFLFLLNAVETDRNFLLRVIIWQDYISIFKEHIFFGIGLQQVMTNITTFGSHLVGFTQAHNWILQILTESGIIGFFIFILFLFYLIKYIFYHKEDIYTFALIGSIFLVLLHGFMEPNLTGKLFSIYLFITIGIFTNSQSKKGFKCRQ